MPHSNIRAAGQDLVTIVVGASGDQCPTTRATLAKSPSWFQSHVSQSAACTRIHLAEEDVFVVRVFLRWLQTAQLESVDAPAASRRDRQLGEMSLIDVFVFAQRYKAPALQDAVLRQLEAFYHGRSDRDRMAFLRRIVPAIYAKTHEPSRLRQYVVDAAATDVSPAMFTSSASSQALGNLPQQFALDVCYKSLCLLRSAQESCPTLPSAFAVGSL